MKQQIFNDVWEALEDNPVQAKNLRLRSALIIAISDKIKSQDMTQIKAAKVLEVTQPRVSALLRGKIEDFRLDTLINMAHRLGLNVSMDIAD